MPLGSITGALLKKLGPKLKPKACTDTWWREIVTPARAVINNAHELKGTRYYELSDMMVLNELHKIHAVRKQAEWNAFQPRASGLKHFVRLLTLTMQL